MRRKRRSGTPVSRVVLYARVSTTEQARKDLSLPNQLGEMKRYCRERGYTVVSEYVESGASGTDDNRPEFQKMRAEVVAAEGAIQAVVVYHSSRFMRDAGLARVHKTALARYGVQVIAMGQETSDDASGYFMEGMQELIDEYESNVNGARTRAAMRENARRGFFNGSRPPFGYLVERTEVSPGQWKGRLAISAQEAEIVREVMHAYLAGQGAKLVARALNGRGVSYRRGQPWNKDRVLRVISERASTGVYRWGAGDGEEGILMSVPPIVEAVLFEAVQRLRAARDPQRNPGRTSSSPLALAGLLKCGRCGAAYQLETSGKLSASGEYAYRYYQCRSAARGGVEVCPGMRFRTDVLDRIVFEHVAERLFPPDRCRELLRDVVEDTGVLRQKAAKQAKLIDRELQTAENAIARWEDAFERGDLTAADGAERLRELKANREDLKRRRDAAKVTGQVPPHLYSDASIERFQRAIREVFLAEDSQVRKNYLRFLVEEIVVGEGEVRIRAKPEGALRMMAGGEKTTGAGVELLSPTPVDVWLPRYDSNIRPGD